MAAGSIVIDLLMRTGSFETDTKRAERRLRELEKSARQVGAAIGTAFAAAATATAYFVKSSIDAADAAIKNAQAIGLTVEAYTALAFAADLSGISQEEMGVALTKLARQAADAAGGSKTAAAGFDALGISLKNVDGSLKDTDTLLTEIADKFAGYADGTEKTALATELFGRSGAKMIPLLNSGATGIAAMRKEAAELGLVMDTQTARAAEQFNDDLTRLGGVVKGFGNDLMRAALPALQAVATWMLEARRNAVDASGAVPTLTSAFNSLAVEAMRSGTTIYVLGLQMAEFAAKTELVARGLWDAVNGSNTSNVEIAKRTWAGFRAISEGVAADTERARKDLAEFERRLAQGPGAALTGARLNAFNDPRSTTFGQSPAAPRAPTLPGTAGRRSSARSAADRATEEAYREAMRAAQERSDARKREDEQIAESMRMSQEADAARLKALTGGAYSEQLKEVTADIGFLNRAYEEGKIGVELWAEAVAQATGRLQQQAEEVDAFAKQMQENVQTFLGGAFADAMEGNFKSIGQAFTQMVNRMVAEALAADLSRRLFGSGGSGEGWIGALVSAASGYFGGSRAGGGDAMPGREYWVGENGPERFRPRTMGTILPAAAQGASGSRSLVVNNSFMVSGMVDRRTQTQIAAEAARAVADAARRNA